MRRRWRIPDHTRHDAEDTCVETGAQRQRRCAQTRSAQEPGVCWGVLPGQEEEAHNRAG